MEMQVINELVVSSKENVDISFINEKRKYFIDNGVPLEMYRDGNAPLKMRIINLENEDIIKLFVKSNPKYKNWADIRFDEVVNHKVKNEMQKLLIMVQDFNQSKDVYVQADKGARVKLACENLSTLISNTEKEIKAFDKKLKEKEKRERAAYQECKSRYADNVKPLIEKLEKELKEIAELKYRHKLEHDSIYDENDLDDILKSYRVELFNPVFHKMNF